MWMCGRAKGLNINLIGNCTQGSKTQVRSTQQAQTRGSQLQKHLINKIYILTKLAFIHNNKKGIIIRAYWLGKELVKVGRGLKEK